MGDLGEAAADYADNGWAVLPLRRRGKEPATRNGLLDATTDSEQVEAAWAAVPDMNVAMATGSRSGGVFVIDIDVDPSKGEDGMESLRDWEAAHGELPETVSAVTGRGGMHLFYRSEEPVRCSTNQEAGVDVRGEGGYVVLPPSVHPNGSRYEWDADPWAFDIAEADANVMAFVESVRPAAKRERRRFKAPKVQQEGGRNDMLFKMACSLQAQAWDDEAIMAALETYNGTYCRPPLRADELRRIFASATEYDKGSECAAATAGMETRYTTAKGRVKHNEFGRLLIEEDGACFVDGAPAIWDGRRYAPGWDEVDRAIVRRHDSTKQADQREIRHYVHLQAPRKEASDPLLIAFENGVLDMAEGLRPYGKDMVITNIVPHDYDAGAYDATADAFLDAVSAGDAAVRANLEEVVGLCMYRSNEFGQCPLLLGSGSNGKSTYIAALRNVLGKDNVSSLDLNVIGRQFQTGRLLGKLANLGDDISNEFMKGDQLAVFKKVVTGEWVYTDVKNGDGFEFRPYCTLVFSANEMPALGDAGEGVMRRLFPIPFDAVFRRSDASYDPRLAEKLCSPEAARYLARLGVEGLQRVIFQNGMTPNARSESMVDDVRVDNNSVLQWVRDAAVERDAVVGSVIAEMHREYAQWCEESRCRPFSRTKFTRTMNERFVTDSKSARRDFGDGSRIVRVFGEKE